MTSNQKAIEKLKSELCLSCMECCKSIIVPTFPSYVQEPSLAKLLEMRNVKYSVTNMGPFLLIPSACKFLTDKGCKIYDKRPDVCRNYDGRNIPMMKGICKWNKIKSVTCNKCGYQFESIAENKNIRCPECKSNESLSVR